jgi:hypothetical protein
MDLLYLKMHDFPQILPSGQEAIADGRFSPYLQVKDDTKTT